MQTLKIGNAKFCLSPTRELGAFSAHVAKCNGKFKPTKIKTDKRLYPSFYVGMSTAEYVQKYETLNGSSKVGFCFKTGFYDHVNHVGLNDEPCALYDGEDTFETIDDSDEVCEVVDGNDMLSVLTASQFQRHQTAQFSVAL